MKTIWKQFLRVFDFWIFELEKFRKKVSQCDIAITTCRWRDFRLHISLTYFFVFRFLFPHLLKHKSKRFNCDILKSIFTYTARLASIAFACSVISYRLFNRHILTLNRLMHICMAIGYSVLFSKWLRISLKFILLGLCFRRNQKVSNWYQGSRVWLQRSNILTISIR